MKLKEGIKIRADRRKFLQGLGVLSMAGTISLMAGQEAFAAPDPEKYSIWKTRTIGSIPGKADLNNGLIYSYSNYHKEVVALVYPQGVGARPTLVSSKTGKALPVRDFRTGLENTYIAPFVDSFDRFEGGTVLPNGQMVFVSAAGLLVHYNPNDNRVKFYKSNKSPSGQLSSISVGRSTWGDSVKGLNRMYYGDFDGRLAVATLPASMETSREIFYSLGSPFGSQNIMSTEFFQGYLYLGLRGTKQGIYRVKEATIEDAISKKRTLQESDFEIFYKDNSLKMEPYQIIALPRKNLLVARVTGNKAKTFYIDRNSNKVSEDSYETLYQPLAYRKSREDSVTLVSRFNYWGNTFLIEVDPTKDNFRRDLDVKTCKVIASMSNTQIQKGGSIISQDGVEILAGTGGEKGAFYELLKTPVTDPKTKFTVKSNEVLFSEVGVSLTQLNKIAYNSATGALVFAPKWVNDTRYAYSEKSNKFSSVTIENMASDPKGSTQIEALSFTSRGRLAYTTYPYAGISIKELGKDKVDLISKIYVRDIDNISARVNNLIPLKHLDGGLAYGTTTGHDMKGSASFGLITDSGKVTNFKLSTFLGDSEEHNISSIETYFYKSGIEKIIVGTTTRTEKSSGFIDTVYDSKIISADIRRKEDGSFTLANVRIISVPEGIKAIWGLKATSEKIFILAQYGDKLIRNNLGNFTKDAVVLLDIPLSFRGNKVEDNGAYVYAISRFYADRGDLEIINGNLLIRANVFLYELESKHFGDKSKIKPVIDSSGKVINPINIAVSEDKIFYTAFDGKASLAERA